MSDTLARLGDMLQARKRDSDPGSSYVASLHHKGLNKILEKVGEECTEVIIAAKDAEKSGYNHEVIAETADLWFHSMVMLSELGIDPTAVIDELARRFGRSGIEEKASRGQ